MLRELGFHPTAAEMKALFDAIDEDRGGSIEIMEFDRWIHDTPVGSGKQDQALPASLEAVQRKCKKALDLVQEKSSTFDIEASFLAFDRNHSGEVSVAEFR
jgi:Ca2+-binding EF-hand superfamily protein